MLPRLLLIAFLFLPVALTPAFAVPVQQDALEGLRANLKKQGVKNIHQLQARGFAWFEVEGRPMLVSDNGRYAVTSFELLDMWNLRPIRTVDDLIASRRINFDRLGLTIDELSPVKFGRGDKSMTIFFDPLAKLSRKLLATLAHFRDTYTFNLVMVSSKGPQAEGLIIKLACLSSDSKRIAAIREGNIRQLPTPDKRCQPLGVGRGMATAKIIGIRRLPYTIAADGDVYEGIDQGLTTFIGDKR